MIDKKLIKLKEYLIFKYSILSFFIKIVIITFILAIFIFKPEKTGRYIGTWSNKITTSFIKSYKDSI